MATNNEVNVGLSGATGTGSFVGSASAALTGTPTLNAYALAPVTAWVAYTPTFTGFGTAASIEFWSRRVGDVLEIRGRFTAGTTTAAEARITLGFNGVNGAVSSSSSVITAIQAIGAGAYNQIGVQFNLVLIESNVGYVTFGIQNAVSGSLTKVNGNSLMLTGSVMSFFAEVPVTTWP